MLMWLIPGLPPVIDLLAERVHVVNRNNGSVIQCYGSGPVAMNLVSVGSEKLENVEVGIVVIERGEGHLKAAVLFMELPRFHKVVLVVVNGDTANLMGFSVVEETGLCGVACIANAPGEFPSEDAAVGKISAAVGPDPVGVMIPDAAAPVEEAERVFLVELNLLVANLDVAAGRHAVDLVGQEEVLAVLVRNGHGNGFQVGHFLHGEINLEVGQIWFYRQALRGDMTIMSVVCCREVPVGKLVGDGAGGCAAARHLQNLCGAEHANSGVQDDLLGLHVMDFDESTGSDTDVRNGELAQIVVIGDLIIVPLFDEIGACVNIFSVVLEDIVTGPAGLLDGSVRVEQLGRLCDFVLFLNDSGLELELSGEDVVSALSLKRIDRNGTAEQHDQCRQGRCQLAGD